jgi:NAD(P)H-flavin reductase
VCASPSSYVLSSFTHQKHTHTQKKHTHTKQATPGARLTNRHPGPINKLLIVISKLGVVPALQFLKALLPTTGGYSVDYANVVWVNERQDQYILHDDLQALFYKYNSKLDVFTVAERDLFMGDLSANQQFRMSIPPPSTDTLAVVAGPEYFVTKAVDYLKKSGYNEDVIVTL